MDKKTKRIFDREDERKQAMQQMLQDYLDSIDNDDISESYNVKKWAAAELIMFIAYYVGDSHYEMMGILDECKDDLRKRHHQILKDDDNNEE